jgi:hypothetical protein
VPGGPGGLYSGLIVGYRDYLLNSRARGLRGPSLSKSFRERREGGWVGGRSMGKPVYGGHGEISARGEGGLGYSGGDDRTQGIHKMSTKRSMCGVSNIP